MFLIETVPEGCSVSISWRGRHRRRCGGGGPGRGPLFGTAGGADGSDRVGRGAGPGRPPSVPVGGGGMADASVEEAGGAVPAAGLEGPGLSAEPSDPIRAENALSMGG